MGKKKVKKLKKKKVVTAAVQTTSAPSVSNESVLETVEREFAVDASVEKSKPQNPDDEIYLSEEYRHVRTDIHKILIVMGIILIVLFGVYFLDAKYGFLGPIGDVIYKFLHIQSS